MRSRRVVWGGLKFLVRDSPIFFILWIGVAIAWEDFGSSAAAAVTVQAAVLTLRWHCVLVVFGSERVRVVSRLWSCSFAPSELAGVGLVSVYTWSGSRPGAVLLYLRDGTAVPVVATARSGYGMHRDAVRVAALYDVPVVVRGPRHAIDEEIEVVSTGRRVGRGKRIYLAYLERAKSPEEVGIEFPVGLRRGRLKPTSLGMDPDSSYCEPELSTWL